MMEQAEVSPELLKDLLPLLTQFVLPFVESLFEPEQKRHALEAHHRLGVWARMQDCRGDRVPARSRTAGNPEVYWICAVGP